MIQANELRIGNLVKCTGLGDTYLDRKPYYGKEIFDISGIFPAIVKLNLGFEAEQKVEVDEIQPIPLTEEWLIRAEFKPFLKDCSNSGNYILQSIIIHTRKSGYYLHNPVPKIKSVHQLQNLYFALTGQELEFKPKEK